MEEEKRYFESDVIRIIENAILLEKKADKNRDAATSLTIAEIEHIAREVGINPEQVRHAASRLEAEKVFETPAFSNFDEAVARRWIPGDVLQSNIEDTFMAMKEMIPEPSQPLTNLNNYDEIKKVGNTFEYVYRYTRMSAVLRDDGCMINIHYSHSFDGTRTEWLIYTFGGALLLSMIGGMVLHKTIGMDFTFLLVSIIGLISLPVFGILTRFFQKKDRRKSQQTSEKLADAAENLLRSFQKETARQAGVPDVKSDSRVGRQRLKEQ